LLYHGTLLYDFPLPLVSRYLASPPRQPDYREGRDHDGFLTNLPISREELREAICNAWKPIDQQESWPQEQTEKLLQEKYSQDAWNHRF
jgi:lipoate-protein ligase A